MEVSYLVLLLVGIRGGIRVFHVPRDVWADAGGARIQLVSPQVSLTEWRVGRNVFD